jgi:hypothetical protein
MSEHSVVILGLWFFASVALQSGRPSAGFKWGAILLALGVSIWGLLR